ncbi:protease complex subunit PrcB family protein [Flavobacterium sp. 7A]|uniref:protease complex subunit PrcB family protein n=1 Tax=Flavobacterium sp. 7A TaxID=2940571 RepID=UPI002227B82B|nr:protease complex subunit PrcB family protein [Flavobacterium sp. 7A]MCW2119964.1 hypothetical protein [Flavobacterium sp. 7A]
MKKLGILFFLLFLISCGSIVVEKNKIQPLYEVLTQQAKGGANIKFFEILSEPDEIKMLLNDAVLRKKINSSDIQNSNFLILNMGEKATDGYKIGVEKFQQTKDSIIITVKETEPGSDDMVTQGITYPYCVLKINSKKAIRIK